VVSCHFQSYWNAEFVSRGKTKLLDEVCSGVRIASGRAFRHTESILLLQKEVLHYSWVCVSGRVCSVEMLILDILLTSCLLRAFQIAMIEIIFIFTCNFTYACF